ncbi:MAG: hypothetical protein CVU69_11710 [Deltaproteobacteria bacterium HGW-Deltaproteobacteria-4]|nr:MAG: hypothetical protein CVU69_11710 [Deltaproteobacteria bacterium HGW-Deltaproteobacteria-4]
MIDDPVLDNLYDPTLMSEMSSYSDLHYTQTDLSLGGIYSFTPALYTTVQVAWQQIEDKDPYVYGDLDGTAWRGNVGLGYKF